MPVRIGRYWSLLTHGTDGIYIDLVPVSVLGGMNYVLIPWFVNDQTNLQ